MQNIECRMSNIEYRSYMKAFLLLAVFILVSASLAGQNRYALTFNHIALSVKDVNRSADFYKNVLDLQEITNRSQIEGIRWFSLGEGKEVHLISTVKENVVINKAVHLALTTTKFDDFIATLNKMKITYSD